MFLLFLVMVPGKAQVSSKIEHYSTENGLSHDGVMTILKDREGFMWFGTWDGINRFDGHDFVTYKSRPGDSSTLKSNRIDHIVEDRQGYLWLEAYDNQIYRFNKVNGKFLAIADVLAEQGAGNVLFDGVRLTTNGRIWLSTRNQGIFSVRNAADGTVQVSRYGSGLGKGFGLPSNQVNFIYADRAGRTWIGTGRGLVCLVEEAGKYRNVPLPAGIASGIAYSCIAESRDYIWLGTTDGDLLRYQPAYGQVVKKQLSDSRLNDLLVAEKQGVLYLVSKSMVCRVGLADLQVSVSAMPAAEKFLSLYQDRAGQLWIEPEMHGVVKYDPARATFRYFFQQNDANFQNRSREFKVFEDHRGRVWVSMKGGGFGYYDAHTEDIAYFHNKPGSATHRFSNIVTCSYFDPAGVLWLSTRDRGIEKVLFQENAFNYKLLVENTLNKSDNEIRGIYSDRQGRLWLSSKSGHLLVSGRKPGQVFVNWPPGGIGLVYVILQDRRGNFWLGTKGNGLFKAVPADEGEQKYRLLHYRNDREDPFSLSSDLIYTILEDRNGRIWVGTYGAGLNLVTEEQGKVKFIHSGNGFSHYPQGPFDKIRHLQEDAKGRIWVATTNGLVLFAPGDGNTHNPQFRHYGKVPGDNSSLGNNDVQYIYRDRRDNIWIATSGGGLNKVLTVSSTGLKLRIYTRQEGLPSDYILSMVEDLKGNLWLATENGISRFDPSRQLFRNFDSYDGLPKTGFSEGSSLRLPNGDLLFGCIYGYLTFNPQAIAEQRISAGMVFTNFQINNKDVNIEEKSAPFKTDINTLKEVRLKYNENIISIDFTVLDYRLGDKQDYAYRLVGFDEEWRDVKNQRKATYTNLPPGNYKFEVKSMNGYLYTRLPLKTLNIKIAPPPWRTVWAYSLYAILLVICIEIARKIIFTMVRLRNRIVVEQRLTELKLRFFTNISHELRTPLTLIVNPIEEIYRQENLSPRGYAYINVVRRNANRMVRFINQLLDFRKVQSGKMQLKMSNTEMVGFINEISSYFSELSKEKHIELKVSANVEELHAWIDAEKMDIVVYNLLSNAFKFSPGNTEVSVRLEYQEGDGFFRISVADQGIGVPSDKLNDIFELYYELDKEPGNNLEGTGIGLALCREITEIHGGKIEARNNDPEKGLTVSLTLKLGKAHFKDTDTVASVIREIPEQRVMDGLEDQVLPQHVPAEVKDRPLVLVVDDNNELRQFLADQLKDFYRVVQAKDGEEGLKMAAELLPDLVLSDVMMPKLDGIRMLDELKNKENTSHIPVVLLTAKSSVENQIEGLKYGADYYITKPFRTDFILASIENLLRQRRKIFEQLLANRKSVLLGPGEIVITSRDEAFLKEIIAIVEERMADPGFNIDAVAEFAGMGRTTFYKKFKSLTNLAPVEFVRDMRLKRSKQLLDAGQHNISEIAYAAGFNSAKYFSTCFREAYGMSPSEYLKSQDNKSI
ncbi:Two component regulator propeller [Pedobacter africanus]|uniref:histidine kinase n=2 Tax=Pedobacter africanus TaxID=151894 RepID=A0A1W2EGD9_9SPHI|nr:Two component regulator propeller [Pedobacter africanus]